MPSFIGPYKILRSIGKGGMGEVFLAYDTICGRRIALKKIRPDLISHKQLNNRFLREARITSQLTHPAIIPIYTIQKSENKLAYYTMPFIEGNTLRQIISLAREQQSKGLKQDLFTAIPSLMRLFLSICQAVAYAHSKGVIHRDIKPNNIIVGHYGEVFILDWGLAKVIAKGEENDDLLISEETAEHFSSSQEMMHEITHVGKVVGTVAYMAPERALGQPANFQTDIYALGVILYQLLTLHHPFHRGTLKEFRTIIGKEFVADPSEIAPYRDVPPILSRIVLKSLSFQPEMRHQTVNELIHELESYIEGRSEWFHIAKLDIYNKEDWEFQENVLLAEHMAITRGTDISDWVSLMISKASFADNTKIEAQICIGNKGHGVGFLLNVPETAQREHLNNGYCLWIGSDLDKSTKLLRSAVEVIYSPENFLERNVWYQIRIEKIENSIRFYLNNVLQFSYISYLPLSGTHLGLLSRDADFSIKDFIVYVGSQNIKVNCLAVPDAFLAHKDFSTALSEYRRIGYSFPGTAEGREALFRAGITLLEETRVCTNPTEKEIRSDKALEEFGKLHGTAGAPLEYLGKALVYQELGVFEEEIKCFELAFRRYPRHPLLPVLQEQLIHRMHETSRSHRIATYNLILLAVRYIPSDIANNNARRLFDSLKKHWEPLYFIEELDIALASERIQNQLFAIQVAFWLAKPDTISECIDEMLQEDQISLPAICNALFTLIELEVIELAKKKLDQVSNKFIEQKDLDLIHIAIYREQQRFYSVIPYQLSRQDIRTAIYLMEEALHQHRPKDVHELYEHLKKHDIPAQDFLSIDCYNIWAFLQEKAWEMAEAIFHKYSLEQLTQESSLLHFLYGCWLYVTEGKEIAFIHFNSVLEIAYPRSWSLFSHFISSKDDAQQRWLQHAFAWEKRQLYQQMVLFYDCTGDKEKSEHFKTLFK